MNSIKGVAIFILIGAVLIPILAQAAQAKYSIPIGLQRIIDYNNQYTTDFSIKISLVIAFVAGVLGILSPCILPFLPAYFSYTFKEKKNITLMTLVFFAGFSIVFVAMGIIAGFIGEQTLLVVQTGWFGLIAGLVMILLGILTVCGKGLPSLITKDRKFSNDISGTFLFGMAFASGWTACLGPILSGILGIGAILHNVWYSALLLFVYSLGNLAPLFVLAAFYDKYGLEKYQLMKGKMMQFSIGQKQYQIHSTNAIAGTLFIVSGLFLMVFQNTASINSYDIFGTKEYFYSLQNALLNSPYANTIGVIGILTFLALVGWSLARQSKKSTKEKNHNAI